MARAIYRSGRVAHVWDRQRPERSGFYLRMRGGRDIGPYHEHDSTSGVLSSVAITPRRGEALPVDRPDLAALVAETWRQVRQILHAAQRGAS